MSRTPCTVRTELCRLVQRFSQGEKKSGQKFRIVATLCSSFHNADEVILGVYLSSSKLRQIQGAQEKVFKPY